MITPNPDWDPLRTLEELSAIVQAQSQLSVDLAQDIRSLRQELAELKKAFDSVQNRQ